VVKVNNVHKTYLLGVEGVPALRGALRGARRGQPKTLPLTAERAGVSVTINRGEFVVILGKSGGGKTSLLNISACACACACAHLARWAEGIFSPRPRGAVGTIDKPTKGELTICGQRITNKTTDAEFSQLRLKRIGFVFQTFNLISSMTALGESSARSASVSPAAHARRAENVELPMILNGELSATQRRERAIDLLTRVGIGKRVNHLPSQLSGGEQQRTTIARALANSPEILLLDEPTGDLDTKNSHLILQLLLDLNRKQGITLIMVTHDQGLKHYAHRCGQGLPGSFLRSAVPALAHLTPARPTRVRAREQGHPHARRQDLQDRADRGAAARRRGGRAVAQDHGRGGAAARGAARGARPAAGLPFPPPRPRRRRGQLRRASAAVYIAALGRDNE
jgi:putative ABC transport system ATP-binding protein